MLSETWFCAVTLTVEQLSQWLWRVWCYDRGLMLCVNSHRKGSVNICRVLLGTLLLLCLSIASLCALLPQLFLNASLSVSPSYTHSSVRSFPSAMKTKMVLSSVKIHDNCVCVCVLRVIPTLSPNSDLSRDVSHCAFLFWVNLCACFVFICAPLPNVSLETKGFQAKHGCREPCMLMNMMMVHLSRLWLKQPLLITCTTAATPACVCLCVWA